MKVFFYRPFSLKVKLRSLGLPGAEQIGGVDSFSSFKPLSEGGLLCFGDEGGCRNEVRS